MAIMRNIGKTFDQRSGEPFQTAEEAWLWYSLCQQARLDGARMRAGMGLVARPCAPDDIAREVSRLYRRRVLRGAHLRVLVRLGCARGVATGGGEAEERLWREALDHLDEPLRAKGIVA